MQSLHCQKVTEVLQCIVQAVITLSGAYSLTLASLTGSLKTVEALIEAGSDPAVRCLRGTSALHHAAEANRMDSIAAILKHADAWLVPAADGMGWTALHYAALHQLPESAALLIQACRFPHSGCTPQW